MTPQEQQMIQGLIDRVQKTQLPEKDMDAEQLLQRGLGPNPDALYILAQSILVQGYALEQAQKQLAEARAQIDQLSQQQQAAPQHNTSFLGSIFGSGQDNRPAPPPPQQAQYAPVANQQPPYSQSYAQNYGQTYAQPAPPQGGGFLRGAMQTAAGVAAGALAFEGIESLMHGFGHSAGYGQDFGGFGGGAPREEIINNYYGDDRGSHDGVSNDIEDRRDDNRFFGDSGTAAGDTSSTLGDQSSDFAGDSFDNSSGIDDNSSFDDNSGSDDSSFG